MKRVKKHVGAPLSDVFRSSKVLGRHPPSRAARIGHALCDFLRDGSHVGGFVVVEPNQQEHLVRSVSAHSQHHQVECTYRPEETSGIVTKFVLTKIRPALWAWVV